MIYYYIQKITLTTSKQNTQDQRVLCYKEALDRALSFLRFNRRRWCEQFVDSFEQEVECGIQAVAT